MFERILIATAFEDHSDPAVDHALELARVNGAHCTLLHVIESIGDEPGDDELEEFYGSLQARAAESMRALAARFDELGVEHEALVKIGVRWETILQVAEENDADLIVIGSRPVLDQEHPHLGSTSHQVFFATLRPLLVVRK
ncbi:MAG: universal stress protein [Deltaproteobacteria bacterium]|nr:universal stress protein [Deltaproteobacteria bacterium]MBW2256870.1 universal stress protein [Deltaproteobacteria bacterium]